MFLIDVDSFSKLENAEELVAVMLSVNVFLGLENAEELVHKFCLLFKIMYIIAKYKNEDNCPEGLRNDFTELKSYFMKSRFSSVYSFLSQRFQKIRMLENETKKLVWLFELKKFAGKFKKTVKNVF
jgi:hypothetical protein